MELTGGGFEGSISRVRENLEKLRGINEPAAVPTAAADAGADASERAAERARHREQVKIVETLLQERAQLLGEREQVGPDGRLNPLPIAARCPPLPAHTSRGHH